MAFISIEKATNNVLSCISYELFGKQLELRKEYIEMLFEQNMAFIHETGNFNSVFTIKLPLLEAFQAETHMILNGEILEQIENEDCSFKETFDNCYNDEKRLRMNTSRGCILEIMK